MNKNPSPLKFYQYSKTNQPKYLVVFLHGYGANGKNLIGLAEEFQETLPSAHYLSLNAIEPWEGGFFDAYQWFSLYQGQARRTLDETANQIKNANQILQNILQQQLKKFNLDFSKLILIGFSQGAMMANYQAMIAPQTLTGVISYSGRIIEPSKIGEKIISKTKTCLIHGKQDSVLNFEYFIEAQKILQNLQIPFEAHGLDDLDHAIDLRGIEIAKNFLKTIIL